jgi:signal transduction histidine kinase
MSHDPLSAPASAERADPSEIQRQYAAFRTYDCMKIVDAVPTYVVVLNARRQVVFGNKSLREAAGAEGFEAILGRRPGEVLQCVHARSAAEGCGTTEFCRHCGALKAILSSIDGQSAVRECRMLRQTDIGVEALDLQVSAVPMEMDGECFTVFSVTDVSHEKRRRALERIFFHDILNLAGGIRGIAEIIADVAPADMAEPARLMHETFQRMLEEIKFQKDLMDAENFELDPQYTTLRAVDVLQLISRLYNNHPAAEGKTIAFEMDCPDATFQSDLTLLGRVLGNFLKNALEASEPGETVTLGCRQEDATLVFWVHNPTAIPDETQLQLFKRSFSTKGQGRGLGTYSAKLITERYLKGFVDFSSSPDKGTRFNVRLPLATPSLD